MDELTERLRRREEVLVTLRSILVRDLRVRLAPDQIDPDIPLFGSGVALDSIDAVDFVVAIEHAFAVRVPDDMMGRAALRSLNTTIDFIIEHS
jgi:acyl carrier protein